MDLSIYSKSLDDFKNSILEVLDKAYSINIEYFYKPNISNKTELSRMWGDEYSLSEPIKQFGQEGTKEYLESKLSDIFTTCSVKIQDEPYKFKVNVEARSTTHKEQLLKATDYVNKYKNVRSICAGIDVKQATEIDIKVACFTCLGHKITVYPIQPKIIETADGLNVGVGVHIIQKLTVRSIN